MALSAWTCGWLPALPCLGLRGKPCREGGREDGRGKTAAGVRSGASCALLLRLAPWPAGGGGRVASIKAGLPVVRMPPPPNDRTSVTKAPFPLR